MKISKKEPQTKAKSSKMKKIKFEKKKRFNIIIIFTEKKLRCKILHIILKIIILAIIIFCLSILLARLFIFNLLLFYLDDSQLCKH